jgi:hypothetical protein
MSYACVLINQGVIEEITLSNVDPFRCSHKSISDMLASYQGNQVIKSPHYLEIFNL